MDKFKCSPHRRDRRAADRGGVALPLVILASLALATPALADPAGTRNAAGLGFAEAIAKAERELGARAFDADLEQRSHGSVYEIDLVQQGKHVRTEVDKQSGKVTVDRRPRLPSLSITSRAANAILSAPKSLGEIIKWVEKSTRGTATDIDLQRVGDRYVYKMELVEAPFDEIRVDILTGSISPILDD